MSVVPAEDGEPSLGVEPRVSVLSAIGPETGVWPVVIWTPDEG